MYVKGGMMTLPASPTPIWRFTDLTKLLALLENESLWFSNVQVLDDPYEAYIRLPTFEEWRVHKIYSRIYVDTDDYTEEDIRCTWECYVQGDKNCRDSLFVNCWHCNNYESAAMWKLYISQAEGVAIRSTIGRLIDAFQEAPQKILIGAVEYVDYDKHPVPDNVYCRSILKRRSFEHEREIRAVYFSNQSHASEIAIETKYGVNIPVHLDVLIDSIYVAPTSPTWMKPLVEAILKRYGIAKKVHQSSLYSPPIS